MFWPDTPPDLLEVSTATVSGASEGGRGDPAADEELPAAVVVISTALALGSRTKLPDIMMGTGGWELAVGW